MKMTRKKHLALINATEQQLADRFAALGLKHGTLDARRQEAAFLSGAMTVINHLFPNVEKPDQLSPFCPPRWVYAPMTGKSVLDMEPLKD